MVAAFGDIWVDIPNQHLVVRIEARRTRVAARIRVPDGCGQLIVGAGSVWLAAGCSPGLLRIDPKTNKIVERIDTLGSPAYPIGYFDGSVWTTTDDLRLLRVDPSSNSVVATTDTAPTARPLFAFGSGSIWLSDTGGGRVLRVARSARERQDREAGKLVASVQRVGVRTAGGADSARALDIDRASPTNRPSEADDPSLRSRSCDPIGNQETALAWTLTWPDYGQTVAALNPERRTAFTREALRAIEDVTDLTWEFAINYLVGHGA